MDGTAIRWPGDTTVVPLGRPDCGWNEEFCSTPNDCKFVIYKMLSSYNYLSVSNIINHIYLSLAKHSNKHVHVT